MNKKTTQTTNVKIDRARRATAERDQSRPRAQHVTFDAARQLLVIEMVNGAILSLPPRLLQGLESATTKQLRHVELYANGGDIHFPELDAQFTVEALAQGIFGTQAWMRSLGAAAMGRKGGSATTDAKKTTARANGAKGGRPRKSEGNAVLRKT